MTSMSSPCSALRRRALARISSTPIEALSSMKILAIESFSAACAMARQVALEQHALAQALRVDARLGGEHAHEQLLLGHLEAEHADDLAVLERGVLGHVDARSDVLPIDGRAAMITRSLGCMPDVL